MQNQYLLCYKKVSKKTFTVKKFVKIKEYTQNTIIKEYNNNNNNNNKNTNT